MNTKKNKKKLKHPPPSTVNINNEANKEDQNKSEVKVDLSEKVIDLNSEIVLPITSVGKKLELDQEEEQLNSPEKPKRKRGKNKKQDEDIEVSEKTKIIAIAGDKETSDFIIETCDRDEPHHMKDVDKEIISEETQNIIPATRKKNKKKGQVHHIIEQTLKESPPILSSTDEVKISSVDKTVESSALHEIHDKKSKKKNKKKRYDSENLEEISCTTAFQMLTVDDEILTSLDCKLSNEFEMEQQIEKETTQDEVNVKRLQENPKDIHNVKQELLEGAKTEELRIDESKIQETQEENQNYKENIIISLKDDNENISKKQKTNTETKIKYTEKYQSIAQNTQKDTVSIDIMSSRQEIQNTETKVKAEIAKIDDNMRKEKNYVFETSDCIEIIKQDGDLPIAIAEEQTSQDFKNVKLEKEPIRVTEEVKYPDSLIKKKKKKTPKIPLSDVAKIEEPDSEKNSGMCESHIHNVETVSTEVQDTTLTPDSMTSIIHDDVQQDLTNKNIPLLSNKNVIGSKPKKKGKKSPKVPLTPGIIEVPPSFEIEIKNDTEGTKEEKVLITTASLDTFIESNIKTDDIVSSTHKTYSEQIIDENFLQQNVQINNEVLCSGTKDNLPFIDTEITNINTAISKPPDSEVPAENTTEMDNMSQESDCPKIDVLTPNFDPLPDIYYPRSTSHENESSNNPLIRELRPDELSLPIMKDAPLIQGSGETPMESPKIISSDVIITEVEPKNNDTLDFKKGSTTYSTDLKSKMLEVNKDMEGLRMSIERSLAEFTALEEPEQKIEKQFEDGNKNTVYNIEKDKTIETVYKNQDICVTSKENLSSKTDDMEKGNTILSSKLQDKSIEKQSLESIIDSATTLQYKSEIKSLESTSQIGNVEQKCFETVIPVCPTRKEHKGRNKKKKGRQEVISSNQSSSASAPSHDSQAKTITDNKSQEKEQNPDCSQTDQRKEHSAEASSTKNEREHNNSIGEKQATKAENKSECTTDNQQTTCSETDIDISKSKNLVDSIEGIQSDYEPIDNFEDALTSSTEDADINKSFEMIVNETNIDNQHKLAANKPQIKIIGPDDKPKETLTPPKNLLGHPDIPVLSNKTDYKKEKSKTPNAICAKVKIKDSVEIETPKEWAQQNKDSRETTDNDLETKHLLPSLDKPIMTDLEQHNELESTRMDLRFKHINRETQQHSQECGLNLDQQSNGEIKKSARREKIKLSTESQTDSRKHKRTVKSKDIFTQLDKSEEFVYKYSFRKVFLSSTCHVCKKVLIQRVACTFCNLLFYCGNKHKDEDWPQHQALCFAISTIAHQKDQRYVYEDIKNLSGQNYRLVRMQMILSCEKVLKRRLVPWEQETLLYPRVCVEAGCRQWKQAKLKDCEGCRQISYCSDNPEHLPKTHQRWCKSYALYEKLVIHQQTKGRLEPRLPTRVMKEPYQIPEKINEVLASMYEEKIDMNDIQYAALTQLATAPLTAAYAHQIYRDQVKPLSNGISKKSAFTIHVVGAEMQFEADALNKWEVFFLHLRPDVLLLAVVLVSSDLNPSNLPLDLLANIKLCEGCRSTKRRITFSFQDKQTYSEYRASADYSYPDLICAFNPSIQRSSIYKELDPWPATLDAILRSKAPFLLTAYSIAELLRDSLRVKECLDGDYKIVSEAKYNSFASVRPDRNFITDDEMPLLFKNYCFMIFCGL